MKIITEEMRYRKRLCEYALKNDVTRAARRYHTNRMFVYRQLAEYDGTVKSMAFKSRRPHSHPNTHTVEEKEILKHVNHYYKNDGLAEIYIQAKKRGYIRSYGSMCKIIKKLNTTPKPRGKRKSYTKHTEVRGLYPGDKVQVDIKYIPNECIINANIRIPISVQLRVPTFNHLLVFFFDKINIKEVVSNDRHLFKRNKM